MKQFKDENFTIIPKIEELRKETDDIKKLVREQVFHEFNTCATSKYSDLRLTFISVSVNKRLGSEGLVLKSATLVISVLGEEAQEEFMTAVAEKFLLPYKSQFGPSSKVL